MWRLGVALAAVIMRWWRFGILKEENRAKSRMTAPAFKRAVFTDLRNTPWYTALERGGVQERWVIFKGASSRLRNSLSQWAGNQVTKAGGLCGWTRSSWLKRNIKSKHTRHGHRVRSPRRNIEILSERAGNCNCCQLRLSQDFAPSAWTEQCTMIKINDRSISSLLFCSQL